MLTLLHRRTKYTASYFFTLLLILFFSLVVNNANANVTNVTITSPTTASPVSVLRGCNVTINFTYTASNAGGGNATATINVRSSGGTLIVSGNLTGLPRGVTNQAESITLTIPAGTTVASTYTAEVSVTQPAGTTITATQLNAINVATATAGPDQTVCATTATLAGNTAAVGTGTWTVVSGSGIVTSPTNPSSGVTGLGPGANTFRWTIQNGSCSNFDDVVITNALPTTANAGPNQTGGATCDTTTVALAGNTPTVGTGTWTIAQSSPTQTGGSFGNASSPASTFTGTADSTYVLRWTISNGSCPPSFDEMVVTFNEGPSEANAGPGQTVCGGRDTTILIANEPEIGTGMWSIISGTGGSFGDASSRASTFTGTADSTYQLRWTISTPLCGSNFDNVIITFNSSFAVPSLTLSKKDVSSCGNDSDGIVKGFGSGGTAPYTFLFLDTAGTRTAIPNGLQVSGLAPKDQYIMRVRDANGCTAAKDTNIIQMPSPSIEVSTKGNASSCGLGLGYFTLRVDTTREDGLVNAIKPYFFQLTPQATDTTGVPYVEKSVTVIFGGLAPGSYKVRMKDSAGCASNFLQNIVISTDTPLTIILSGYHHPSCGANNGNITVLAQMGSHHTYRYAISTDGTNFGPFQSGRIFGGLGPGTYTVRARDSRGCTADLVKELHWPEGCPSGIAGSSSSLSATAKNSLNLQALPNPTRTAFTLNLQSDSKERVQIIVTDMLGKKVYQTTGSANQQYTFGKEFTSGMYVVQVIQGKKIQTLKLVKGN